MDGGNGMGSTAIDTGTNNGQNQSNFAETREGDKEKNIEIVHVFRKKNKLHARKINIKRVFWTYHRVGYLG